MREAEGPELVVGLVTPVGTNTGALAKSLCGALSDYNYTAIIIKLSDYLPNQDPPLGEGEDERVLRLIAAGDEFCREHASESRPDGDPAAMARLAIKEIREARVRLSRQDGMDMPVEELPGRPRTAYILHSLKRVAEVGLLREAYGDNFILIGSQDTLPARKSRLANLPMSSSEPAEKAAIVEKLIRIDADETDDPVGQHVNDVYPLADFFLRDHDPRRAMALLFGEPIPPEIGEYAMYAARASRARSLALSRKVGAAIVVGNALVATGYNDVPVGQTSDVHAGEDTSEQMKQANVRDTIARLREFSELLNPEAVARLSEQELVDEAIFALKGGDLLSVIEYQRAVHAEARAIDDATLRRISPAGGTLYVTTYPCHLCYKHALSVEIERIEYIEPYPKSRAASMFPQGSEDRLLPYAGVAPRMYMQIFDERKPFEADATGQYEAPPRSVAMPLVGGLRNDTERDAAERLAVHDLNEE